MTPLEEELRWESTWNIAALGATVLLSKELNFPIKLERIHGVIRPLLDKHYLDHEYGVAAGRLHFVMASALRAAINEEEERQFFLWGERTFALEAERAAEFFWRSVVYDREEVEKPKWMEDTFAKIRNELAIPRERLKEKLHMLQTHISELDKAILARINMTEESLATAFSLTVDYNIFACSWRTLTAPFSIEQLSEIYDVGKKLAYVRSVSELVVAFPGTWDFGKPRNYSR